MKVMLTLDEALAKSGMREEDFAAKLAKYGGDAIPLKIKQGRVKAVRLTSLAYLCDVLNCEPGDILRRVNNE